jgi:hypothetical protein
MNRKLFLFTLLTVALLVAACGLRAQPAEACSRPQNPPPLPRPRSLRRRKPAEGPSVLKIANTANITTWDPIKSFSTEAAYMANLYEQLLRINPPGGREVHPPAGRTLGIQRRWHGLDLLPAPGCEVPRRRADECRSREGLHRSRRRPCRRVLHLVDAGGRGSRGRPDGQVQPERFCADRPGRVVPVRELDRQPEGARSRCRGRELLEAGIEAMDRPVHGRILHA